jgi:purine-binding chemotaxis protein CheW
MRLWNGAVPPTSSRLASSMGSFDHQPSESLVIFSVEEQRFGLDIATVQRVLRAVALTPLPNAPAIILGLANVRGVVVPVFDIRRRLGLPEREVRPSDHLLMAQAGARTVGLMVDAVHHTVAWDAKAAVGANDLVPGMAGTLPGRGECIQGVAKLDGGLVYIYDLARFLSLEEEAALESALAQA